MFLDLDEVKRQLNKTGSVDDADITAFINATANVIERHTGKVPAPAAFTDQLTVHGWQDTIRVTHRPLVSVTSVTVEGNPLDMSAVQSRTVGIIRLGQRVHGWVDVAYQAGEVNVPDSWISAGMIIVQHLWSTRRGYMISTNDPLGTPMDATRPLYPYAIPKKALELLGPASPQVF